jgi:hypothetical protein
MQKRSNSMVPVVRAPKTELGLVWISDAVRSFCQRALSPTTE